MPINKFDLTNGPVVLYNFERNLLDSSGNDLHASASAVTYRHIWPNLWGVVTGSPARPIADALLCIPGDVTINAICVMRVAPVGVNQLVMFTLANDSTANNTQYEVDFMNQNNIRWMSEHSTVTTPGIDSIHTFLPTLGASLPVLGVPFLLSARRQADVATLFINGDMYGLPSPVLPTPTGGNLAHLILRGGTTTPEVACFEVVPRALSDEEIRATYMRTLGEEFGPVQSATISVESLWAGALTADGITVAARMTHHTGGLRLAVTGTAGTTYGPVAATVDRTAKLSITGLDPDTAYTYQVQLSGVGVGPVGSFRTAPAAGPASFKIAFSGDANTHSNAAVFARIPLEDPLLFVHMGDIHYSNVNSTNQESYHIALDNVFAQSNQSELYRNVPTVYMFDDHDFCGDNSDGSFVGHDAACAVYRKRVPHYPLADVAPTAHVGQAFTIGRVLFLVTDQRSASDPRLDVDDVNKTMLGASQKAWFKAQIAAADGMAIVWVCPRVWGGDTVYGADHWGGFATERTELIDFIHAEAPGRVCVLSADMHLMGIDDGSNHDFATGGGEPLKTFQCAPLDRNPTAPSGGLTYSEGHHLVNGVYGTMQVTDTGGSTIGVLWEGRNSAGTLLTSYTFAINI